jgi:hypothetical protein
MTNEQREKRLAAIKRQREEDDKKFEEALCGLEVGGWRIDMDEYDGDLEGHYYEPKIAVFLGRTVIGHNPNSKALELAAKTLAELAEQVKARGY